MCCSGGPVGGTRMTRCGVVCGLAALAALSTALLGPAWLHTEEKLSLPYLPRNFANVVSVRFKLGLFRVCPKIVKPSNLTVHISTPPCSYVRYSSLEDVRPQELGFHQLEFTPTVISKISHTLTSVVSDPTISTVIVLMEQMQSEFQRMVCNFRGVEVQLVSTRINDHTTFLIASG
ncbi:hypothetical protein KPH14_008577 [Odynerus spinipes]|uniref:Uncharacterized protein n=1 Tax=Odynerus spinipes TaxID=1348599 RepID=A0AAD9RSJ6_9HYME|nr:hypothetical protein KPH14_008577 [Odynerus spinipes]